MTSRQDKIRRMRADHSELSRPSALAWVDSRLERRNGGGFPATGAWSFRETCDHHWDWVEVGEHWLQCRRCHWCKPRLGRPPDLESLPAILEGRVLPPLSGGPVDLGAVYANAGFVVDDGRRSVLSVVRVKVVQHAWVTEPLIRRCGAEVRFRGRGWREAAVFMETRLHRLIQVLREAAPRRPRALWRAIQAAMEHRWSPPWEREGWEENTMTKEMTR